MSLVDRLMAKIKINAETGCWEWTAADNGHGYGAITIGGRTKRAHRVSYEAHCGPIPDKMIVCHRCDNKKCINPGHLFLGTPLDNTRDMIAKGRQRGQPPGIAHTRAKLTEADVIAIRAAEGVSQKSLSERYCIDQAQISRIRAGNVWTHLAGGQER